MKKQLGWVVIALVYATMVGQTLFFYSRLPQTIASHFDLDGNPDGWLDKAWFFVIYIGLQTALTTLFWMLGKLTRMLPRQFINIPNRDFWMRTDTQRRFFDMNEAIMIWIAALTAVMLLVITQFVFHANLADIPINSLAVWMTMVLYLASILGILLYFYRWLRIFG